jgi:hypothetical protein
VLYASATGASDVNNLAYATGWVCGDQAPPSPTASFRRRIREGGIAAMELVARDLKAWALHRARALLRWRRI